jgi:excisionase family DNA binding protein
MLADGLDLWHYGDDVSDLPFYSIGIPVGSSPSMKTHEELMAGLETKAFFSVPETALLLGTDDRTVRRAIGKGTIPATQVGCLRKVPTDWLREQVRPACAA